MPRVLHLEAGFNTADFGSNIQLTVVETGGAGSFTVTISGRLFLRTSGALAAGDYAAQVQAFQSLTETLAQRLNAAGTAGYSVVFDDVAERVTIAHDGSGGVSAIAITAANTLTRQALGFGNVQVSGALSHTGRSAPFFWLKGGANFWSDSPGETEEPARDVARDIEANDGTPRSIAKSKVPTFWTLTVPLEPEERVWRRYAPVHTPWTWQDFFRHARSVRPFVLYDGRDTRFLRLQDTGARFVPRPRRVNYHEQVDIRLETRVLGAAEYLFRYPRRGETEVDVRTAGPLTIDPFDVAPAFLNERFAVDLRLDFASPSGSTQPNVFRFPVNVTFHLRFLASGPNSILQLGTSGTGAQVTFPHAAGARVRVIVDWANSLMTVLSLDRGVVIGTSTISGDWSAANAEPLQVGHSGGVNTSALFSGLIGAPRKLTA